jgi:hypothetical protein
MWLGVENQGQNTEEEKRREGRRKIENKTNFPSKVGTQEE